MSGLGNKEIMAKNIKRLMELKGKDRNDVCNDLGFKYTTFTDWINANTYPRIDKIEMMANYFGVTKADLVEEKSDTDYYLDKELCRSRSVSFRKPRIQSLIRRFQKSKKRRY